ncbi:hypothetical protein VMCG_10441 [Cytospora schulzeri]|uniref:Uncharacterized protein n=1 Tax=Cytospora schulzeri TaxID=448051 RepID=A0A423VB46_9PEZI|nr:hypothetical protein VMCG_10441 [Valsa malicola]
MHRNTPSSPPSTTSDQAVTVRVGTDVPFTEQHELFHQLGDIVPDQPLMRLDERVAVSRFLVDELPLHHQAVKSRRIIITEKPDLDLVWHYSRIFIKPIPLCMLTHSFWAQHIQAGSPSKSGVIAQEARLIPRYITWDNWCRFIQGFKGLSDAQVSKRYQYGEIRLTRLNFWVKVFFQGWIYHEVHHNYATYFAQFITPYIFVFGGLSVVLTAFQAMLAANTGNLDRAKVTVLVDISLIIFALFRIIFVLLRFFFLLRVFFLLRFVFILFRIIFVLLRFFFMLRFVFVMLGLIFVMLRFFFLLRVFFMLRFVFVMLSLFTFGINTTIAFIFRVIIARRMLIGRVTRARASIIFWPAYLF